MAIVFGTGNILRNNAAKKQTQQTPAQSPTQSAFPQGYIPTQREVYGRIKQIGETDPEKASRLFNTYKSLRSDKNSPYYSYYSQPTNQAVKNLQSYGFNTDYLTNGWLDTPEAKSFITSNLEYRSGSGNTPSSPIKSSTLNNRIAYELNQYMISEENTKNAEKEYNDIINAAKYWATAKDKNYSDSQIVAMLRENMKKDYPTLYTMEDKLKSNSPYELNRVVDFSDDVLYAAIWEARNPNYNGGIEGAMANSYLGLGNQWKDDPSITAKLNRGDLSTYAPYTVGSTMDKERAYFGRDSFDQQWVDDNRTRIVTGDDETAKKYFNNVVENLDYTEKLKTELKDMRADIEEWLASETNPEWIIQEIRDNSDYKDLFALDKTLISTDLKATTSAVDYNWNEIESYIRKECKRNQGKKRTSDLLEGINHPLGTSNPDEWGRNYDDYKYRSNLSPESIMTPTDLAPVSEQAPAKQKSLGGAGDFNMLYGRSAGLFDNGYGLGTIDLNNRPVVQNDDGSISTERSMSFYDEESGKEVLIPTVVDGKIVSDDEAIDHYYETVKNGNPEYLGMFDTPEEADKYAVELHERQEEFYSPSLEEGGNEPNERQSRLYSWRNSTITPSKQAVEPPLFSPTDLALEEATQKAYEDIAPTIRDNGTPAEISALITGDTVFREPALEAMLKFQVSVADYAASAKTDAYKKVEKEYGDNYSAMRNYESAQTSLTDTQGKLDSILPEYYQLDSDILAYENVQSLDFGSFDTLMAYSKLPAGENRHWDDVKDALHNTDKGSNTYNRAAINLYQMVTGHSPQYLGISDDVAIEQAGLWMKYLDSGKVITMDDMNRYQELAKQKNAYEGEIRDAKDYVSSHEAEYTNAKKENLFTELMYNAAAQMDGSLNPSLFRQVQYVYDTASKDVTYQYAGYYGYDQDVANGKRTVEDAASAAAQDALNVDTYCDDLEGVYADLVNQGANIGNAKSVRNSIDSMRDYAKYSAYAALDGLADFDSVANKAISSANKSDLTEGYIASVAEGKPYTAANPMNDTISQAALRVMNQNEARRYFYLKGSEGEDAANEYLDFLLDPDKGMLTVRHMSELQTDLYDFASDPNSPNAYPATAMAVGLSLVSWLPAEAYRIKQTILNEDRSPYNMAFGLQVARDSLMKGSRDVVTNTYKNMGAPQFVVDAMGKIYDIGFGGAELSLGSALTGGIFEAAGVDFNSLASGLSSLPVSAKIAKSAADVVIPTLNSANQKYRSNLFLTNDQDALAAMYAVDFAAGLTTHAVIMNGLHSGYTSDGGAVSKGIADFFKKIVSTDSMVGVSTFASSGLEAVADKALLGANSNWQKNVDKYHNEYHYPLKVAEQMADQQMWAEVNNQMWSAIVNSTIRTGIMSGMSEFSARGGFKELGKEIGRTASAAKNAAIRGLNQLRPERGEAITYDATDSVILDTNGNPVEAPVSGYLGGEAPETPVAEETTEPSATLNLPAGEPPAKTMQTIMTMYDSSPSAATTATISILNTGNINADTAASSVIVGDLAFGDSRTVAMVLAQAYQTPYDNQEIGTTIVDAALTNGEGNTVLRDMFEKTTMGQPITQDDVRALINGVNSDKEKNPEAFDNTKTASITDRRVADETVRIASSNSAIKNSKDLLAKAQESEKQAEKTLQEAEDQREAIIQNAQDSIETLATTGSKPDVAPVQHTLAQADGADNAVSEAEKAVEVQQKKVEEAEQKVKEAETQAMNEARQEAQATVAKQEQAEAEERYNNSIVTLHPSYALGHSVKATDSNNNRVNITGVYDIAEGGNKISFVLAGEGENAKSNFGMSEVVTVYTTDDGRLVTGLNNNRREKGKIVRGYGDVDDSESMELADASDNLLNKYGRIMHPKIRPLSYLPSSFPINANGQQVQIIGLAGKYETDDGAVPVILGIDGKLYSADDPSVSEQLDANREHGEIIWNDFFDNEEKLPAISGNKITHIGEETAPEPVQSVQAPASEPVAVDEQQQTPPEEAEKPTEEVNYLTPTSTGIKEVDSLVDGLGLTIAGNDETGRSELVDFRGDHFGYIYTDNYGRIRVGVESGDGGFDYNTPIIKDILKRDGFVLDEKNKEWVLPKAVEVEDNKTPTNVNMLPNPSSSSTGLEGIVNGLGLEKEPGNEEGVVDLYDVRGEKFGETYTDKEGHSIIRVSEGYDTPDTRAAIEEAGFALNGNGEWVSTEVAENEYNTPVDVKTTELTPTTGVKGLDYVVDGLGLTVGEASGDGSSVLTDMLGNTFGYLRTDDNGIIRIKLNSDGAYDYNNPEVHDILKRDGFRYDDKNEEWALTSEPVEEEPKEESTQEDVEMLPSVSTSATGIDAVVNGLGLSGEQNEIGMTDLYDFRGERFGYTYEDKNGNVRIGISMDGGYDTPEIHAILQRDGFQLDPKNGEWVLDASKITPTNATPQSETPATIENQGSQAQEDITPTNARTTPQMKAMKTKGAPIARTATERHAAKVKSRLKSPQDVFDNLLKEIGVASYRGVNNLGKNYKTAGGVYDPWARYVAVRSKNLGNIGVEGHEAGHAVFDMLDLESTPEMIQNMIAINRNNIDFSQYGDEDLMYEAQAEFFRSYLENEDEARELAGDDFYNEFESTLASNPKLYKAVAKARDAIRSWVDADESEKLESIITLDKHPTKIRLNKLFSTIITRWADDSAPAEEINNLWRDVTKENEIPFDKDVRAKALLADDSSARATVLLNNFLTKPDGTIVGDSLSTRITKTGFEYTDENMMELNKVLVAFNAIEREANKKGIVDPHITTEGLQKYLKNVEAENKPVYDAALAVIDFWKDVRKLWLEDEGFITPDVAKRMDELYPHYAPMAKATELADEFFGGTGTGKYHIYRAKGGTGKIFSPFQQVITNTQQVVKTVLENSAARALDDMYQSLGGMGEFARMIPDEEYNELVPSGELNNRQEQLIELLSGNVPDDMMEQVLDITKSAPGMKQAADNQNILTVHRTDGSVVHYQLANPYLYKLLAGVTDQKNNNPYLNAVRTLTRSVAMLTTGLNPGFAVRNASKDFQNSVNYGTWATGGSYLGGLKKWFSAFNELRKGESEDAKNWTALGGGGWEKYNAGTKKGAKAIEHDMFGRDTSTAVGKLQNILNKTWNILTGERLNSLTEQASRFVQYKYGGYDLSTPEGRQKGRLAGREVTNDFSRGGAGFEAAVARAVIPFFNPSMQGVYRTGRQLTRAERENVGGRVLRTVANTAITAALAISSVLISPDRKNLEEQYNMLSDQIKKNHIILPNPLRYFDKGQDTFIRIPLSQDALSLAVHSLVTNALWKGSTDEWAYSLASTVDAVEDIMNPFGGTVFQPFIDSSHHRTWFKSSTIRSYQKDWADPTVQYNEDTADFFKWAGRVLDQSPEDVEYVAKQMLGYFGQLLIPMISYDKSGNLQGVGGAIRDYSQKWTTDASRSSTIINDFYSMKNAVNQIITSAKDDKPENLLRRTVTQAEADQALLDAEELLKTGGIIDEAEKAIQKMYKDIDAVYKNNTLTSSQQAELARELKMDGMRIADAANDKLLEYYDKYMKPRTMVDNLSKLVGVEGKYAHVPTDIERLDDVFKKDTNASYMKRATSVYNGAAGKDANGDNLGGGRSTALPHPSRELTINKQKYTITDKEWSKYTSVYKKEYEQSLRKYNDAQWSRMSDHEKYVALQNAHTNANKAVRTQYARDHKIKIK